MMNKSHDVEKGSGKHTIAIVLEDTIIDGHETSMIDVEIDGFSIVEGEIDWEEVYGEREFHELPNSLRLLSTIMSVLGEYTE
jgi:hypothetical protein